MTTRSKTTDWLTTRTSVPSTFEFTVNGKPVTIQADSHYPLLWALRDDLKLTGTKFGCGIGECAVCVVDVDGKPSHSCITPVSHVVGKKVTTIEGLASNGQLTAVQRAWIDEQVPQCGWCQSGQIMMAEALLREHPKPTDAQMDGAMFQVLCRCGTYPRIKCAIKRASGHKCSRRPTRCPHGTRAVPRTRSSGSSRRRPLKVARTSYPPQNASQRLTRTARCGSNIRCTRR
jgi:isoquinoline 1-oxidoreductase alpha subunit